MVKKWRYWFTITIRRLFKSTNSKFFKNKNGETINDSDNLLNLSKILFPTGKIKNIILLSCRGYEKKLQCKFKPNSNIIIQRQNSRDSVNNHSTFNPNFFAGKPDWGEITIEEYINYLCTTNPESNLPVEPSGEGKKKVKSRKKIKSRVKKSKKKIRQRKKVKSRKKVK